MKTESVIRKRAERLRDRYLRRHVQKSQERRHQNCVHNREITPRALPYSRSDLRTELDLSPRVVTTLVVIQEERPVRVCTYGSEDPSTWNGDVCDSDSTSFPCKFFRPLQTPEAAAEQFMESLLDDKHVFDNYRDLAALQWVLGDRRPTLPWYRRLLAFFLGRCFPAPPASLPSPPPGETVDDPALEDLWRD